jgi:hypothetical protein
MVSVPYYPKRLISGIGLTAAAAVLLSLSFATARTHAEESNPQLAAWSATYWYWAFGDPDDAGVPFGTDAYGNTSVVGVVLMPLPDAPGDGTPASIDVTLNSGESFYLPLWNLIGTSYTDGTPPDEFFGLNVFKTLDIRVKIDGVAVITTDNVMNYYARGEFDPEIEFGAFGIDSIIWFQGVSILHAPLSAGKHVITLDAKNTIPVLGATFEYHNTWNATVKNAK